MTAEDATRTACAEMARYLAVMLVRTRFDATAAYVQAGERIGGPALSAFEHAEHLFVHQLGLGRERSMNDRVLLKSTAGFSKHFASGRFDSLLPEVVRIYLGIAEWSGDIPTTRQPFQPPSGKELLVESLLELGYLEAADDAVRWTDKAGPAMLDAGAWGPEFTSSEDK